MLPSFPQIRKGNRDSPHSYHQKEQVKNDQLRDSSPLEECEFLRLTYFPFPTTEM